MQNLRETNQKLINYWIKTAEHDYTLFEKLYTEGFYSDSLFFGHLVLEKILKAYYISTLNKPAPLIHNLIKLYIDTGSNLLDEEEITFLGEMNEYNLSTRYPDYRLEMYNKCNLEYTRPRYEKIKSLYVKICRQIKIL